MAKRITVIDGKAVRERKGKPLLSAARFLKLTASAKPPACFPQSGGRRRLEGFLFPATYDFDSTTTTAQLVQDQLRAFCENWSTLDLRYARKRNLTAYDVLTIASMIEAEVKAPEERKLVAAVIYNRLRLRMPLGIDATIRYGRAIPPTRSITAADLRDPTPYNTRLHRGLPPTPISNPGLASLLAATAPAKVGYLYYIRRPDKFHHFFTSSYVAFLAYKRAHYGNG